MKPAPAFLALLLPLYAQPPAAPIDSPRPLNVQLNVAMELSMPAGRTRWNTSQSREAENTVIRLWVSSESLLTYWGC